MTTSRDAVEPPDPPPQTLILLDRVRQGDTAAVNGLLERHRAAIRRMIDQRLDRVVRKRVDASDINRIHTIFLFMSYGQKRKHLLM